MGDSDTNAHQYGTSVMMMAKREEILATEAIDKLLVLVEEATRATADSPRSFIEPARGTLDRAKSRRHHLVFGRRGSGKTSLLNRALADLSLARTPAAFVDLEAFKGHSYPDVLLSVLIETLRSFDQWLADAGSQPGNKITWWRRVFGARPERPPLDKAGVATMRERIGAAVAELRDQLERQDGARRQRTVAEGSSASASARVEAESEVGGGAKGGPLSAGGKVRGQAEAGVSSASKRSVEESIEDSPQKIDFLHRRIIEYQRLLDELVEIADGAAFVFLDDLYHLDRGSQASVLDYFHRIVKGRGVWLKIGTIRHRTDWYRHGNPPIGLKLGDDADEIDLDITLEKYETAKGFLTRILDQLLDQVGISESTEIATDGAIDRLVLASGGVARDFLTIFKRSVNVARERGLNYRGASINAEDVNSAAGEQDPAKRDELKRDTAEERHALEDALAKIREFCISLKANCFLVERDQDTPEAHLIGELVDLRFLHVVRVRTTVRGESGKLYTAYMLDISQYTGERKRRELELIDFWKGTELEKLRQRKYVFNLDRLKPSAAPPSSG